MNRLRWLWLVLGPLETPFHPYSSFCGPFSLYLIEQVSYFQLVTLRNGYDALP